ncbi:MAG: zinc-binding alcohol dehydrogenase [Hyphomicrobiaceae bacterium]
MANTKNEAPSGARRRSVGRKAVARALWYVAPGKAELKTEQLAPPMPGEARVRTSYSAISRGTERLVFSGAVGPSEWNRMACPMQTGRFPFPVKYGYCATGIVDEGPDVLVGRPVFALHPHQDIFVAPVERLCPLPDGLEPRRATLAANMETALNAHWDAGTGPGDSIVVVGAGVVGLLVAYIAARLPGTEVTVIDVAAERHRLVEALGATFALPDHAPNGADVVFHTSVSAAGLNAAIRAAGREGTIVELSWYGDRETSVALGDAFHSQRLKLISSQVGMVSGSRRERWSYRRRLEKAMQLLTDPILDALLPEDIAFDELPARLPALLAPGAAGLAPVVRY